MGDMANNDKPPVKPLAWILAGVLGLGFVVWLGGNDSGASSNNVMNVDMNAEVDSNAAMAVTPDEPLPLDVSAAQRGYGQFRAVSALHDTASPPIFSRNCYDALGKAFDWHQLDRCGGFDALAARAIEQDDSADEDELAYFQSETAATRFLQAATTAGLDTTVADERWARLQRMALKARLPKAAVQQEAPADLTKADDNATESNLSAIQELLGNSNQ